MDQLVGQLLDQYRIVQLLGQGGMGSVYEATDMRLKRRVAVKVMHAQFARQPQFQQRFLQEAQAVARLDHPGIVKVHGFNKVDPFGTLYIAMEFLPGGDVRKLQNDLKAAGRPFPLTDAVQLMVQLCLAVDYAHRQGVIHRDLKPDNVMLKNRPGDGLPYQPVLTDLGLARFQEGAQLTEHGAMGTPAYMSPEQARAEPTDARSDVYSLGVMLYELIVGRLPYQISTISEAANVHNQATLPPLPRIARPDLPEVMEAVILKSIARNPADRFANAAALAQALGGIPPATIMPSAIQTNQEPTPSPNTSFEPSVVEPRGDSIMEDFPSQSPDPSRDQLQIVRPGVPVRTVAIKPGGLTIGRVAGNDVVLDHPKVSKNHARIEYDGATYRVTDMGSTNGTFLGAAKLLAGIPENWPADQVLRVGAFYLRIMRSGQPAGKGGLTEIQQSMLVLSGAGRVGVVAEPSALTVMPGVPTAAIVTALNQGELTDHFAVSVLGVPAEWVSITPAEPIQLNTGDAGRVTVTLNPPRAPQSRAGDYPVVIRVASRVAPDEVVETKLNLKVEAYAQFISDLRPAKLRVGKPAQITIENQGNTPQPIAVAWRDRGEELLFEPPQAKVVVPEGKVATVSFQANTRRRPFFKLNDTQYMFSAEINAPGAQPQIHTGELVSPRVIPYWLLALTLFLCLALSATGVAGYYNLVAVPTQIAAITQTEVRVVVVAGETQTQAAIIKTETATAEIAASANASGTAAAQATAAAETAAAHAAETQTAVASATNGARSAEAQTHVAETATSDWHASETATAATATAGWHASETATAATATADFHASETATAATAMAVATAQTATSAAQTATTVAFAYYNGIWVPKTPNTGELIRLEIISKDQSVLVYAYGSGPGTCPKDGCSWGTGKQEGSYNQLALINVFSLGGGLTHRVTVQKNGEELIVTDASSAAAPVTRNFKPGCVRFTCIVIYLTPQVIISP